ncbi:DUF92 domain-containing protein [Metabacillus malikii]|uniref:Uncharacterized protein (TIGR00297 family) n=1 Tax=Metabacillus malikii TaxID=1504265 RepID=A0ABT9ZJK7_9BACI|nr:DUF92 domain-containing protein [Metabacillus malikii]MDQ0231982.1 uncharacterized protein (TIGR00297 family) [Metabacillus malikii]
MFNYITFIILIICVSYIAYKLKSLTLSGAITSVIVGFSIYLGFSYNGLLLLGCFFVSSSLFSKCKQERKSSALDIVNKGGQRDSLQVLANGGIPTLIALISIIELFSGHTLLAGFCISLAAATSDTWASEIGTLSKQKPRMLFTFKKVPRGTSGAISLLGTSAAIAGSFLISMLSSMLFSLPWNMFIGIFILGFLGNVLDTILGQTIQVKYKCEACGKITERKQHCRMEAKVCSRFPLLNNDAVNLISISIATIAGMVIYS